MAKLNKSPKLPSLPIMARDLAAGSDPEKTGLEPDAELFVGRPHFLAIVEAAKSISSPPDGLAEALDDLAEVETPATVVAVPSGSWRVACIAVAAANPVE